MKAANGKSTGRKKASKLGTAGIAATSTFLAFAAWGYLVNLVQAKQPTPEPASTSATQSAVTQREQELGVAKAGKAKESSSNVLLNDPFMQNKWGLEKTHAAKAWEITKGSKDIVIAVIDTGIDSNHKDLGDNLWANPGESGMVTAESCKKKKEGTELKACLDVAKTCEKDAAKKPACNFATNGIDDDKNSYVDDVHGWNFVHANNQLTDNHGHGSHIAGIIAAKGPTSSGTGVSGVAPNVSVMVLKYYDPKASNSNNLKNTVQAIRYAIQMKANIINYSGGGVDYSAEEFAAVKDAEKAGILFVAAAGNERSNSDEAGKHYYPADYGLSNIISVTAVNKEETKVLASSNYGVRTVDLAAPGENIYSTLPGNTYGFMTGTSQATAFVTGVAALIMSHNRQFSAADVKKYILRTGDEYATLLSKTGTAKLLNSYKALTSLDKGVGLSGVIASNTAKVGAKSFSSDQNLKDPKLNTSAFNNTADESGDTAESIAMFGKDFLKALGSPRGAPEEANDIRAR